MHSNNHRRSMVSKASLQELESHIRDVADFPKKGILFKDIMPLLSKNLYDTIDYMGDILPVDKIEAFAGIESRGFIFGTALALKYKKPFVPIRKKGKLPPPVHSETYQLEYGEDSLEMACKHDFKNILIVDDVIATGGTYLASKKLCEKAGLNVLGIAALINLKDLNQLKQSGDTVYHLFEY
jgi:adenine phosphoribosyltransferase